MVTVNKKDLGAGLGFLLIAAFFGLNALSYQLGTVDRMGPGFFPVMLAGVLFFIGLAITARAFLGGSDGQMDFAPFRGIALVALAPVMFGLTVRGLGLLIAVALTVLMGALASRDMRLASALTLTAVLTAFCAFVFWWALRLNLPLVGIWLQS